MKLEKKVPTEKGELIVKHRGVLMVWFESLEQSMSEESAIPEFSFMCTKNPHFQLKQFESDFLIRKKRGGEILKISISKTSMNFSLFKPLRSSY